MGNRQLRFRSSRPATVLSRRMRTPRPLCGDSVFSTKTMIASINPATGETLRTFTPMADAEVDGALERAEAAWRSYRHTPLADRARWLTAAAEILESEKDRIGRIMTLEMGKPIAAARAEAAKCASACRYYAEHGEQLLADEPVDAGAGHELVRYQPIGPVLAVMPWNFPFWQVFRFAAPALMAGNVGLLKHASNVPQCALEIEEIVRRAGFPPDVFQTLLIGSRRVGRVIDDPRVMAATLTGSEPAGAQVARQAGERIKKTVLELGGSDPFVVMPSADLDRAVRAAVDARIVNNGQSCIAAKRFIVDAPIYAEFERRFVAGMEALRVGDPMEESTQVGPLATPEILEGLDGQVAARWKWAGGFSREESGSTVRAITTPRPCWRASRAGAGVSRGAFRSRGRAFPRRAGSRGDPAGQRNRLRSGRQRLDQRCRRARALHREVEAGMVFINSMVASDPRLALRRRKALGLRAASWAPAASASS